MSYTLIPQLILNALQVCLPAGLVPSVRSGQGGDSHSVWFVKFMVRKAHPGHYDKLHAFEVPVPSSYSQQFLNSPPSLVPASTGC